MTRDNQSISRRTLIQSAGAAAGLAVAGHLAPAGAADACCAEAKVRTYTNADFYVDGKFQMDKAREAYLDMFARFNYPAPESLKKGMWVLEFGLGDFVHCGMAGIFWLNRKEYGYFGHEIYLLPGQMIAEHTHHETKQGPAKMESWHVRHGMIYTFGEGEPTKDLPVKLPASQEKYITARCCKPLRPGELGDLNRLTAPHFMLAGPEGAIVTEYGTFHDMDGLRFTNPNAKV